MKTTFDIKDKLYPILHVTSLTTLLSGGHVYRDKKPLNSEKRDVEIVSLPIDNGEGYDTQHSTAIINAYAVNFDNGQADEATLKTIITKIIGLIEAYSSSSNYFEMDIVSESIMQDMDEPRMSYGSLRVNCTIEV